MSVQLQTPPPPTITAARTAPVAAAEFVHVSKTYKHPLFRSWKVEHFAM